MEDKRLTPNDWHGFIETLLETDAIENQYLVARTALKRGGYQDGESVVLTNGRPVTIHRVDPESVLTACPWIDADEIDVADKYLHGVAVDVLVEAMDRRQE